ncbi:MAG: DUF4345 domain-containing protein [Gammaproteobacteria bacterium]
MLTTYHKVLLWILLGLLAISLVIPGLIETLKLKPGITGLLPTTAEAKNQFRALHGMMMAVGLIALWACLDLENSRHLVMALGVILLTTTAARAYSLIIDGLPSGMTLVYLAVELSMALVFLIWPPALT